MSVAYCAIADVSALLPSGASYTDDEIQTVIDFVKEQIDLFMEEADWFGSVSSQTIIMDGSGTSKLMIRDEVRPLVSITSILIDEVEISTAYLEEMEYDSKRHIIYSPSLEFYKGTRNIDITGTFGYASVPGLLTHKAAKTCVKILRAGGVGDWLESNSSSSSGSHVKSVKFDDATVDFDSTENATDTTHTTGDSELDDILWKYKSLYPLGGIV